MVCGFFDVRFLERGDNFCYEMVLNIKSWLFWFVLYKYLYRIVGCCFWVFFYKIMIYLFFFYCYNVIYLNLCLYEELKNIILRIIEVCKIIFRNVCNEIKFNVYYNKKKFKLIFFIKKIMIIILFGDFLFRFFWL